MIITNVGGPVTVGDCHLLKGANEVEPSIWQNAKQHRLVQAFLKSGRLFEGAHDMPPRGVTPPGAVPRPDVLPRPDPRRGIPTAANLRKPGTPLLAEASAPAEAPAPPPAPPAAVDTPASPEAVTDPGVDPPAETPPAEGAPPAESKDATEYAAADARLIVQESTSLDDLKAWKAKETRKTVVAEIDARIAELES